MKTFEVNWGAFALIEFLLSGHDDIGTKFKNCLDIGAGECIHTEILRIAGLQVSSVDKYSDKADYKLDFNDFVKNCEDKFDVIFCSHVIEHQRNVGLFLDNIYDLLSEDGVLIISAPSHAATTLIEGHLNSMLFPLFLQHLIHAGFDCKNGKYLSTYENSFIVSKAYNFNLSERLEVGYTWSEEHNLRSMFELKSSMDYQNKSVIYNCTHTLPGFNFIPLYEIIEILYGITIKIPKYDFECAF